MIASFRKVLIRSVILITAAFSSGCLFKPLLNVSVSGDKGGALLVNVSTTGFSTVVATLQDCLPNEPGSMSYTCTFIQKNGPFQHENFISTLTLTGTDAASQRFPDPVVIQLPTDASDFTGAFLHVDSGVDGKLAMTTGLSSLRADSLHILKAKPGTQLIVLDLPEGVPTTGDFQFRFNFKLPAGASSLEFKPMFTGRVKVNGETFYPPLLPCVMDFASVPAVTVEASLQDGTVLPEGETVTIVLPLEEVLGRGCANMIYEFPTSAAVDMRPGSGSNGFNSNGYGNLAVVRPYEGILMRFNAPPVSVY